MNPRLPGRHALVLTLALGGLLAAALPAATARSATARSAPARARAFIEPPVAAGTLRISGTARDGSTVAASGLTWRAGQLPKRDRLLSFEVATTWLTCANRACRPGADTTATPFAARRYVVGHADVGRALRVTQTATEVVQTRAPRFSFTVVHASRTVTLRTVVIPYPAARLPATEFVNGLPESGTGSPQEIFQVDPAHYSVADGPVRQRVRIDGGAWQAMPKRLAFATGTLRPGRHRVTVLTADRAGRTTLRFGWRIGRIAAPRPCSGSCWYPPHLGSGGRPMRWDWQIGRTTPLQRTGSRAVDIYDIDGFLTTRPQVRAIRSTWQAATLAHPRTICYLDLAWEDYRPDGSTLDRGGQFPAAALGRVYYGYPQERWVDFRQLRALAPMLRARISMCARKGFDAVELDDIDSFSPASTTGFDLTAGDAQNYLAFAFNLVHSYGMTALWKNSPELASWGARYTDGAVVEECYIYRECASWHAFSGDRTAQQPTGKWVGEAEYGSDHFVCDPGKACQGRHSYAAFCHAVYSPADGFAAVKFDVNLDGKVFFPCPDGR